MRRSIVAVLFVAALGIVIGRAWAAGPPARTPEPTTHTAPTARSALLAAIGYLNALRWEVLVDDAKRRELIERLATPQAAPKLDAELAPAAEALREAVSRPPVVARRAVLGYRVSHVDAKRAAVRIWGMALFGSAAYRPATQWSTSDVALDWTGERWLVDGIQSHGGPSPALPVAALARQTYGLREVRHVP